MRPMRTTAGVLVSLLCMSTRNSIRPPLDVADSRHLDIILLSIVTNKKRRNRRNLGVHRESGGGCHVIVGNIV